MDQYEKAIREKVYNILSEGEWVYLVGLFNMAVDHADCGGPQEIVRLRAALQKIADADYRGNRSPLSVTAYEALNKTAKEVLAKWIGDNVGNIDGGYLTEHRGLGAERIVAALRDSGFVIIRDRSDPEGGIPGRNS